MREYEIAFTDSPPQLDEGLSHPAWQAAAPLAVDQFNWHEDGPTPATTAFLLYDEEALYAGFEVEDWDISATVTELNGPTFEDSSVELFADPGTETHYFNFEANCCGYFKLAWQERDWNERGIGRDLIDAETASGIDVETSEPGPTRSPAPDDEGWWLTTRIPFAALSTLTGREISPASGTHWRANVYRSGVATDEQKATWNPMPTPEPDYHSPEYFGRFRFG